MANNMYGQNGWMPSQPQQDWQYYQNQPQQSFSPSSQVRTLIPQKPVFVDGEMAARVFQLPDNWPIGVPLYLWDTNGGYFYVKFIEPNGVPAPLQTFQYNRIERQQPTGYISGSAQQVDTSQFVTKEDLDRKFDELKEMMWTNQQPRNQNSGNGQQNRGGNQ